MFEIINNWDLCRLGTHPRPPSIPMYTHTQKMVSHFDRTEWHHIFFVVSKASFPNFADSFGNASMVRIDRWMRYLAEVWSLCEMWRMSKTMPIHCGHHNIHRFSFGIITLSRIIRFALNAEWEGGCFRVGVKYFKFKPQYKT